MNYSRVVALLLISLFVLSPVISDGMYVVNGCSTNICFVQSVAGRGYCQPGQTIDWPVASGEVVSFGLDGTNSGSFTFRDSATKVVAGSGVVSVVNLSSNLIGPWWYGFCLTLGVGFYALGITWFKRGVGYTARDE